MNIHIAKSLDDACQTLADNPEAEVLAGGTDFMVEVNYRHRSPAAVVAVSQVPEIGGWRVEPGTSGRADSDSGTDGNSGADGNSGDSDDSIWLGAALTFSEIANSELANLLPALAQASRTVGSPQIRNAGTLGGNLGTASPAGDSLPVLAALDARIMLRSTQASREMALCDFITGPKQTCLEAGELIEAIRVPKAVGHSEFLKVGTRNAMVISVAGLALFARTDINRVCVGLGSVSAVPVRAAEAEDWISPRLDWQTMTPPTTSEMDTFGDLVSKASSPIDDHRSTADYRRHAVGVMAKRALLRAFSK